eukprot:4792083-Prymnesium_polylepis.1
MSNFSRNVIARARELSAAPAPACRLAGWCFVGVILTLNACLVNLKGRCPDILRKCVDTMRHAGRHGAPSGQGTSRHVSPGRWVSEYRCA